MTQRILMPILTLLVAALSIRQLWFYWAARCNEACPVAIGIAMYVMLIASVLYFGVICALMALGKMRAKVAMGSIFAGLLVSAGAAATITYALLSSGVA